MTKRGQSIFSLLFLLSFFLCQFSFSFQTPTRELLENQGLDEVADKLSDVITLFDSIILFSTKLNQEEHIDLLNFIISAMKKSIVKSIDEALRTNPSGVVDYVAMVGLMGTAKKHFYNMVNPHVANTDWNQLVIYISAVFDNIPDYYHTLVENVQQGEMGWMGLPLNWTMLKIASPMISLVPEGIVKREYFGDVPNISSAIHSSLHQVLETAFSSEYGPMIKVGVQMAANMDWNRILGIGIQHDEL